MAIYGSPTTTPTRLAGSRPAARSLNSRFPHLLIPAGDLWRSGGPVDWRRRCRGVLAAGWGLTTGPAVGDLQVVVPVDVVEAQLPPAGDGIATVREGPDEPLREPRCVPP